MKKIFILGVGAQKSATTWLYRQIKKSDFVDFRMKEYHVFDLLYLGDKKIQNKLLKLHALVVNQNHLTRKEKNDLSSYQLDFLLF